MTGIVNKQGGVKDFRFYAQRFVFLRKKSNRALPDLVFMYTVMAVFWLVFISIIVCHALQMAKEVLYFNYVIGIVLVTIYLAGNYLINLKLLRYLFLLLTLVSTSFLWVYTEGSSGPSILIILGYVTMLVFISMGREFNIMLTILVINTIGLFVIEYLFPDFIEVYQSHNQKTLDILSLVSLLFLFEIPLLIYARTYLYKERNQAIESAESKSSILANMSHEIRTPMNAIIGFTELMSDPQLERKEIDSYLKIVNQNSRTLMNLLNNVINMSKLESGSAQVYISRVSANEVIKFVYETLKSLCVNSETELRVEYIEEEKAQLEVDENLLFQIIVNLGYNAIKFTSKGVIAIKANRSKDDVIFSVKDTGCGIPKEEIGNLFERFSQVKSDANIMPANGAGLGLSICKGLIDLMQGEIWCTSEVGVGSEFFVKLPVVSQLSKK
ncbi:HAMP domain-containing histidine kinase [Labilibacter sediminis]|nr:HAMP domain-containing histidine kinase [Labilibacter sediminis]